MLLIHQIPPRPNYFRVKIWRRLQRLGAVGIKNSVYALPAGEQAQEDLNWVRARSSVGAATLRWCRPGWWRASTTSR